MATEADTSMETKTLGKIIEDLVNQMRTSLAMDWTSIVVWFDDGRQVGADGRSVVRSSELLDIDGAQPGFDALCASRPAWINLSCVGLLGRALLVSVEGPPIGSPSRSGYPKTSFNFSGPRNRVKDANWDATAAVDVVSS